MEQKICCRCKNSKTFDQFCKHRGNKDGLNDFCRDCNKAYHREHYQKNKAIYFAKNRKRRKEIQKWFQNLKNQLKCEKCGESHPACLDFHHINPSVKEKAVSLLIRNSSKKKILEEIAKCKVWCCKCHRIWHWDNQNAPIV